MGVVFGWYISLDILKEASNFPFYAQGGGGKYVFKEYNLLM
jgi:hypothetical protein